MKNLAGIVVPYSFMCALLNLYYYWKPFGVQPFEFISFGEVLAYTMPFLMMAAFMLVPVFVFEYLWPRNYPQEGTDDSNNGYVKFLAGIVLLLNIAVVLLAEIDYWSAPIIIGLICGMLPIAFRLSSLKQSLEFLPSRAARMFLFLVLCCMPATSILHALMTRTDITHRTNYLTISGTDISSGEEVGNLVYIGRLGNYLFLLREKNTVAYRLDSLKKLELKKGATIAQNSSLKANSPVEQKP